MNRLISATTLSLCLTMQPCLAETGIANDEGPFTGGVFARLAGKPIPPSQPDEASGIFATQITHDEHGNSNELIVIFDYAQMANTIALSPTASHDEFERAIVDALEKDDAIIRHTLLGARHARLLTHGMRLHPEVRARLPADHPRERLEQYIVLRYDTVKDAIQAREALPYHPAVTYLSNNSRIELSWSPNDPYLPIDAV